MRKKNRVVHSDLEVKSLKALNQNQSKVLHSNNNQVLSGFAGTGKTFLASYLAYKAVFIDREFSKIIYLRSAVPTRDLGFLPGSEEEKLKVYEAPYADIATELFGRGDAYEVLKKREYVEFMSTSYIRGRNLNKVFIVVDECQNMSYHELDSIITRLNGECRIIFCGDIRQADLYKNGVADFWKVIKEMNEFDFTEFQKDDIVRSELVKNYIIKKDQILDKR